jgi:glycosyltransferase involved in cell wall biosynthesis
MQISIIIPTYNGEKKILNALRSLEMQTFKEFEVIVVIDGSTDNTKQVLEKNNFNFKSIKIIYQENKGRSGSRNTGAQAASTDLLLFLDDDMRLPAESLQKHIDFHRTHPSICLMGNAIEDENLMKTDLQRYRAFLSRKWSKPFENNPEPLQKNNFFLMAAHLSIPKETFFQLGAFDEALTDAEDYDLGKKALQGNIPILFKPEIIGWHDDFITCRSYIRRQQQYKQAHEKLKMLYPERYQNNPYDYKPAKGFKRFTYWFFAGNFWVNTIDKFNFLLIFPQKLRYKLYDIIITANAVHFPLLDTKK